MDPVYGFASTNAEAQERSTSSLLHWMRRLIGVRQAHRVFGRGGITFMHPDNRHIAAYVREFEGEVVLCVANLARTPQAVSLDLSRFTGRTPVEMLGWSAFPPIVDDRYVITLHGHAFFWFVLVTAAEAPVAAGTGDAATARVHHRRIAARPREPVERTGAIDDGTRSAAGRAQRASTPHAESAIGARSR